MNIIQQVEKELNELVKFREDIEKKNAIKESINNVEAVKKEITAVFEKKSLFSKIKSFFIKEKKTIEVKSEAKDLDLFMKYYRENFQAFAKGNSINIYEFLKAFHQNEIIDSVRLDLKTYKIYREYIADENFPLSSKVRKEVDYEWARDFIIQYSTNQAKEDLAYKSRKNFIEHKVQNESFEDIIQGE